MDTLSAEFLDIARQLEKVWQETSEDWHDSTFTYFERNYWWPLAETMLAYLNALRALEQELSAVNALTGADY